MADGVDHIDIYADVGEEFNQVGEGLGAAAGAAAGRTLTRAAAGREPARLQTVRPWHLWAAPRCAASPHTLFSRVVLWAAGLWSAGPGLRAVTAARPLAPSWGRPHAPLLATVAGASRRARPRVRGGENGPPRPLPRRGPERETLAERASARRLHPGPAASGSDSSRRSILCLCPRTVASWKAAFTALCIPRAGSPWDPASVGDRFRRGVPGPAPGSPRGKAA